MHSSRFGWEFTNPNSASSEKFARMIAPVGCALITSSLQVLSESQRWAGRIEKILRAGGTVSACWLKMITGCNDRWWKPLDIARFVCRWPVPISTWQSPHRLSLIVNYAKSICRWREPSAEDGGFPQREVSSSSGDQWKREQQNLLVRLAVLSGIRIFGRLLAGYSLAFWIHLMLTRTEPGERCVLQLNFRTVSSTELSNMPWMCHEFTK